MPSDDAENLFAVTTRSRLRGPWFFPQMMVASLRVRAQLRRDTQVVRWASIVAGPSEFWTITVWRSRHDMQEFMRSGAHDDIMWLFSKWLQSFWLMRWRPGPVEMGDWKGMTMAQAEPNYGDGPANGTRDEVLEKALEHLPKLKSSMAADGTINYDTTVFARRRRAEVGSAGGAVVHIHTEPGKTPVVYKELRALKAEAEKDDALLRGVVGISRPGDVYYLSVWRDREGVRRLLSSPQLKALHQRWPGCWANEWIPENEFGHWDGLRLRRARTKYSISVPQAALDVAEPRVRRVTLRPGGQPGTEQGGVFAFARGVRARAIPRKGLTWRRRRRSSVSATASSPVSRAWTAGDPSARSAQCAPKWVSSARTTPPRWPFRKRRSPSCGPPASRCTSVSPAPPSPSS